MKRRFHFQRLGFERNPFGALTQEEWQAVGVMADVVRETAVSPTSPPPYLQLIAPKGIGKTSNLLQLFSYAQEMGQRVAFERLGEGEHHLKSDLDAFDLLILDEAQRLYPQDWWRLLRWCKQTGNQLFFSSHVNVGLLFKGWGLPLVTIRLLRHGSAQHWQTAVNKRLRYFACASAYLCISAEGMTFLYAHFQGNFRATEWFLYEVWQYWEGDVKVLTAVDLQQLTQNPAIPYRTLKLFLT